MVFEKVREIIAAQFDKDPETLSAKTRLVEDLGADSANVMVLILDLENEFGIEVEDDIIMTLKTVDDVVKYIEQKKK